MRVWNMRPSQGQTYTYPELGERWMSLTTHDSPEDRFGPMVVEWRSNRVKLGDFIWPQSYVDIVARKPIAQSLIEHFKGARAIDVEMRTRSKSYDADFWSNNSYSVIWIEKLVSIDEKRSTFSHFASSHGRQSVKLVGVEGYYDTAFNDFSTFTNATMIGPHCFHVSRTPGMGVYVDEKLLDGADFFRIRQLPMILLCTDRVADAIRSKGYTNIDLLEYGETF